MGSASAEDAERAGAIASVVPLRYGFRFADMVVSSFIL
jgi:hypothetical protein